MVTADDRCENAGVAMVAFVREDAGRDPAAPEAQNALAIARFRPAASPADPPSGVEWERRLLEKRPLIISLRI
jgi:hypothetical protein